MSTSISVIIPTIGRDCLVDSVQSVLAQPVEDLEVLVVVDGPHTLPTLPDDGRIQVLRRPVSGGAGAARNTGIAAATKGWITFLDDDDLYAPDFLQHVLQATSRAGIVLTWRNYFDDDTGRKWDGRRLRLEGDIHGTVLTQPIPHLGTTTVRRDLIETFDETLKTTEDVEWWIRQSKRSPVTTAPVLAYLMRIHSGERRSLTSPAKLASRLQILEKHPAYFRRYKTAGAYHWKRAGGIATALGERRTARRAFAQSLRFKPSARTAYHLLRTFLRRPGR